MGFPGRSHSGFGRHLEHTLDYGTRHKVQVGVLNLVADPAGVEPVGSSEGLARTLPI